MEREFIKNLITRYLILIILGVLSVKFFYIIFSPLTIFPAKIILGIFYEVSRMEQIIYANGVPIEIIGACVAGSAYYLFVILNLATPEIKINKRITMLLLSFTIFLAINILRIVILAAMSLANSPFFDFTHTFFWYFLSTIFVVAIWFFQVKIFKIKKVPFYSDIQTLFYASTLKKGKNSKRGK